MKATPEIFDAIEAAKEQIAKQNGKSDTYGCDTALCRQAGLRTNYLSRLKPGQSIGEPIWEKLEPFLKPFLQKPLEKNVQKSHDIRNYYELENVLERIAPGRQLITGVINVGGVPVERIQKAIREVISDKETREKLLIKIFEVE